MRLAPSILISSSPLLVSLPFTVLDLNRFREDQPRAIWQPPDYAFGIVWPILYVSLFTFNMLILRNPNISKSVKLYISRDTLIEAGLQGLWLYLFRFKEGVMSRGRMYFRSLLPMFGIVGMSIYRIFMIFKNPDLIPYVGFYLPYAVWVNFAHILNWQLFLGYTK